MEERRNNVSGGPHVPLVVKVKKTATTDNSVSFSGEEDSITLTGPKEDIKYFKNFNTFVVTFQPVEDDTE